MVLAAVGQICSTASIAHNLAQCRLLVSQAAEAGAKALFLPEASDYIATSAEESIQLAQPLGRSAFVLGLREAARVHSLPISVGVHELGEIAGTLAGQEEKRKVKNTHVWIDELGEVTQRYEKIHLFDVKVAGSLVLMESRSVERGTRIHPPFATPVGTVGMAICFDLRFPELSLSLRRQGAQILTYPSAFTIPTGRAHWEVLLRARAIESQAYVIAAAQAGAHNARRASYGRSMIVNPWGEVVAQLPAVEGDGLGKGDGEVAPLLAVADIDLEYVEKVRTQVPLIRRTDVYPEV